MKNLSKLFMAFAIALPLFLSGVGTMLVPAYTAAQTPKDTVCEAINGPGQTCDKSTAPSDMSALVRTIVQILSVIAGVIAVIMIIVAGMKYTASGGDANKVASAKNALIFAIIGLVIVALSQFMVRFVLKQADNVTTPPAAATPAKKK